MSNRADSKKGKRTVNGGISKSGFNDKRNDKTKPGKFIPRIPAMFLGLFFLVWGYIAVKNYYVRYPVILEQIKYYFDLRSFPGMEATERIKVFINYIKYCLQTGFILLSCMGLGAFVFEGFRKSTELTRIERGTISFGLGVGITIFITLILGMMGLLYARVVLIYMVPGFLYSMWYYYKLIKHGKEKDAVSKLSLFEIYLITIFAVLTLVRFIGALAPSTFYDSQHYHLAIPLYWVQHHKISTIPFMWMSYFPLNFHVIYTLGILLFQKSAIANLINCSFSVFTCMIMYVFGKKYFSRKAAMLAVVIFYSIPMGAMLASRSGVEMGLAFFEIYALFSLVMYLNSGHRNIKWLILSGIFCGLAVGGKHTSILCMVALAITLFIWLVLKKSKVLDAIKLVAFYALIIAGVASPWYIRNAVLTGNPVYPQFYGKLSSYIGDIKAEHVMNDMNITSDRPMGNVSFLRRLMVPWDLTMAKYNEGYSGAVFLFLLPLLFLIFRFTDTTKILLIHFSIYYVLWLLSAGYLRYFIPAMPVISMVLASCLIGMQENSLLKKLLLIVVCIMFLTNVDFILKMQKINQDPLGVALGLQSKFDYLSKGRPSYPNPYYPIVDWANRNTPIDSKILFIGETRAFFSEREFVVSSVFDKTPYIEWIKQTKSVEGFYDKLRREKITHILYNLPEAARLSAFSIFYWNSEEQDIFSQFWQKYVKVVCRYENLFLYEIMSPEEFSAPHIAPQNLILALPDIMKSQQEMQDSSRQKTN